MNQISGNLQTPVTPSTLEPFEATFTIYDDADVSRSVQMRVLRSAFGLSVDLLDANGNPVAGVSADFFENTFRVLAHNPETFAGQDPVVNVVLVADVTACPEYRDGDKAKSPALTGKQPQSLDNSTTH